ncbi:right-handed parallel beta-helix repeat-containing protein [Paenibacillus spiritus]|uniref:Right-handed parallel beta-helix repeat-containing protein n=1 Tax=Paenibacillus spiritus TaxID=2496557 RepID=A0A5J5FX70_9BACL|nr:right-handed parallel beta-helix repeat-containing protein [Paenibacillus spiritus]KAA8997569.1 right-handed parallel beta-helix repeat-containing protein [Paenibacillus spiritus]
MKGLLSKFMVSAAILLAAQTVYPGLSGPLAKADSSPAGGLYAADLAKWSIYNNGSHAPETTKGINEALAWAHGQGYKGLALPSGTYLIDKDSRINMVSDMTFQLPADAVLQKETNGRERYELMYLGYGVQNVTLQGGVYKGDRDTHDYTKKDNPYTAGTHESGFGIALEGASNVVIDGVKTVNFTGDGIIVGGVGQLIKDVYPDGFVSGGLDAQGRPVKNAAKIRTRDPIPLTNDMLKQERKFEISNTVNLPGWFEANFYNKEGKWLKKVTAKIRDSVAIPDGAVSVHLVFTQASAPKGYLELWSRVVSENVVIQNSESANNRRQGVTVGGADRVRITNSVFHDMKGTAPQSGIDVEGGYGENGYLNTNILIDNNEFYNNASYDVILYDGRQATVSGNHFASKGVIGLAVAPPFQTAAVQGNHFDGTRILAYHDAVFTDNRLNDSYTYFEGPNIAIDGMEVVNGQLSVSAKTAFGVSVKNVDIRITDKKDGGLFVNGQPIQVTNATITGEPKLRSFGGSAAAGSVFTNLKVLGYSGVYGLSLPPGKYVDSRFEAAEGGSFGTLSAALPGAYTFERTTFVTNSLSGGYLYADNKDLALSVSDSTFEVRGSSPAVSVQSAKSVRLEGNAVNAAGLVNKNTELFKINDYFKRTEPCDVFNVVISGNTLTGNLAAVGISTQYAGVNAPPYRVENNVLVKLTKALKTNDIAGGNVLR